MQAQTQGYDLAHPNIHPICQPSVGACEGAWPADTKLQDLYNTGQQQDIQEES